MQPWTSGASPCHAAAAHASGAPAGLGARMNQAAQNCCKPLARCFDKSY